jgi:hypothetical protein
MVGIVEVESAVVILYMKIKYSSAMWGIVF